MKQATLIIATLLCLINASEGDAQDFQGGVTAGINLAQIDGDGDEGFGKLGLNAGAFVARPLYRDQLFWQMGVRYTSRGKYKYPTDRDRSIDIVRLHYMELPLSLHYFYRERFQVELGFAPDVLLREYYADEDGPISPEFANELSRFGLTAFAGAWYYPIEKLGIGVRYNYSVIPFYKFEAFAVRYRDTGFFHDVLSLNARYYFLR